MYYLVDHTLKDDVLNDLLKEKGALFDTHIMTFGAYLRSFFHEEIDLFELYKKLTKLDLKELKYLLNDSDFLNELLKNRQDLSNYEVDLLSLEVTDEYRHLLENTPYIPYFKLKKIFRQKNFKDFVIYDGNYEIYERELIAIMLKNGAEFRELSFKNKARYYQNVANLTEAFKEMITLFKEKELDLNDIGIIASSEDLDYVKIHLKRLGLPYKSKDESTPIFKSFLAYLDYYFDPTKANFMKIIDENGDLDLNVFTYLNEHCLDYLDNTPHLNDFNSFYQKLEEKALEVLSIYQKRARELLDILDYQKVIEYVFNLFLDDEDVYLLKNAIEEFGNYEKESYPYFSRFIKERSKSVKKNGITLANYQEGIYYKKYLFILNPHLNNYPGTIGYHGLLSERSLINTSFPSLLKRYENNLEHFNYIKTNEYVLAYLGSADFEGKAFEYDAYFKSFEKIDNNRLKKDRKDPYNYYPKLDKSLAYKAFIKDDVLRASVSSLEKYSACPYEYFLNRGLDLYTAPKIEMDTILVGNVIHKAIEEAIQTSNYQKDYPDHLLNSTLFKELEDTLKKLYPTKHKMIEAFIFRIKKSIERELPFLIDFEKHTLFKPEKVEYHFDDIFFESNKIKLRLKGSIDRIDHYLNDFRILDYKTSKHTLKIDDFLKGENLKLITYAYIYQKLTSISPALVIYLNIHNQNQSEDEYKFSLREGLSSTLNDDEEADYIKNHRLEGLNFKWDDDYDDDQRHINIAKAKKVRPLNFDDVAKSLEEILEALIKKILDGDIRIAPNEKECDYCPYHTICHFRGLKGTKREKLASLESSENEIES